MREGHDDGGLGAWVKDVNRLMKRDWCIDTADAGLSEQDLARYWRNGDEPAAFVAWFAEKYDLSWYGRRANWN